MSQGRQESGSALSVFQFSYNEHEWDVDGEEAARAALLQAAAKHPWVLLEEVDRGNAEKYCGVESLDALLKLVIEDDVPLRGEPREVALQLGGGAPVVVHVVEPGRERRKIADGWRRTRRWRSTRGQGCSGERPRGRLGHASCRGERHRRRR
jgi:hypothetical protein